MIVLLNVLLMCAWPCATFFFSLRRTFLAPWDFGGIDYFAFFLPATVLRGPLRVRAFV
jgi:hypothetical protein